MHGSEEFEGDRDIPSQLPLTRRVTSYVALEVMNILFRDFKVANVVVSGIGRQDASEAMDIGGCLRSDED